MKYDFYSQIQVTFFTPRKFHYITPPPYKFVIDPSTQTKLQFKLAKNNETENKRSYKPTKKNTSGTSNNIHYNTN